MALGATSPFIWGPKFPTPPGGLAAAATARRYTTAASALRDDDACAPERATDSLHGARINSKPRGNLAHSGASRLG
jgi:hypothetical protein